MSADTTDRASAATEEESAGDTREATDAEEFASMRARLAVFVVADAAGALGRNLFVLAPVGCSDLRFRVRAGAILESRCSSLQTRLITFRCSVLQQYATCNRVYEVWCRGKQVALGAS